MVILVPTTDYEREHQMDTVLVVRCANETCARQAEHHTNYGAIVGMADFAQTLRNQGWLLVDNETAYCPRCRKEFQ
jgi:hypothetical protein